MEHGSWAWEFNVLDGNGVVLTHRKYFHYSVCIQSQNCGYWTTKLVSHKNYGKFRVLVLIPYIYTNFKISDSLLVNISSYCSDSEFENSDYYTYWKVRPCFKMWVILLFWSGEVSTSGDNCHWKDSLWTTVSKTEGHNTSWEVTWGSTSFSHQWGGREGNCEQKKLLWFPWEMTGEAG